MALSTAQLALIEQRITNDGPNTGIAYLLWLFTGIVGGHRFYLGRPGSAVLMIVLNLLLVGLIWLLIDGFLIGGMVRAKRDALRQRLMMEALAVGGDAPAPVAPATPPVAEEPPAPGTVY